MAQVPYDPVPQGAPGPLPTEGPRVDTPGAAFGTNIGEALQRGGAQVGQAGNELFQTALQIQNLSNENVARQTSIAATGEMSDVFAKYDSLEGQARADAFPQMRKDLEAIRLKYRTGLNPMAARFFDAEAANLQNSFTRYGALQAGRGIKDEAIRSTKASIDLESKTAIGEPDLKTIRAKADKIDGNLKRMMDPNVAGWTEADYEDAKLKEFSRLWANQIGLIEETNVEKGFELYSIAKAAGELTDVDDKNIQQRLFVANRNSTPNTIADKVYAPGKPADQAIAEAREISDPLSHGDNQFWPHVQAAVKSKYTLDDYFTRRQNQDDVRLLDQAVGTDKFHTTQEMLAVPELRQAMERLAINNPKQVMNWQGVLDTHWKIENKQTNDANYHMLYEMAYKDPQNFLGEVLSSYPMSDSQRRNLEGVRHSIMQDPNGDPRVTSAMKWMQASRRGDLQALNIFDKPGKGEDNPDWGAYIAALQGGIEAYVTTHGKNPDRQEVVDVIGPAAIRSVGVTHKFMGMNLYTTHPGEIPQDALNDAKEEIVKRGKAFDQELEPSDQEVQAEVRRQQFIKYYSKGKQPSGGPTPTQTGSPGT